MTVRVTGCGILITNKIISLLQLSWKKLRRSVLIGNREVDCALPLRARTTRVASSATLTTASMLKAMLVDFQSACIELCTYTHTLSVHVMSLLLGRGCLTTTAHGGGYASIEMCSSIRCQDTKTQYCYNSGMAIFGAILMMASFSSLKVVQTLGTISSGLYIMPELWVLLILTVFPDVVAK